jgi:hypothetical protein
MNEVTSRKSLDNPTDSAEFISAILKLKSQHDTTPDGIVRQALHEYYVRRAFDGLGNI